MTKNTRFLFLVAMLVFLAGRALPLKAAPGLFDGVKYRAGVAKASYELKEQQGIFASDGQGSSMETAAVDYSAKFPLLPVFRGRRLLPALNMDFTPFIDFDLARELVIATPVAGSYTTPAEQNVANSNPDAFYRTRISVSTFLVGGALSMFLGSDTNHFLKLSLGVLAGGVYYDGEMTLCQSRNSFNPCVGSQFIEDNAEFSSKPGFGTLYGVTLYERESRDYTFSLLTFETSTLTSEFEFELKQSTRPPGTHKVSLEVTFTSVDLLSFVYWF